MSASRQCASRCQQKDAVLQQLVWSHLRPKRRQLWQLLSLGDELPGSDATVPGHGRLLCGSAAHRFTHFGADLRSPGNSEGQSRGRRGYSRCIMGCSGRDSHVSACLQQLDVRLLPLLGSTGGKPDSVMLLNTSTAWRSERVALQVQDLRHYSVAPGKMRSTSMCQPDGRGLQDSSDLKLR
jgi:hypothetical protein